MCFCIAENVREQLIDGPCQNCGANTTEVICQRCEQMRFCSTCKRHLPDHCYDNDSVKCQVIFQNINICINLIYTSRPYQSLNAILVVVIGVSAEICTHSFGFERDTVEVDLETSPDIFTFDFLLALNNIRIQDILRDNTNTRR